MSVRRSAWAASLALVQVLLLAWTLDMPRLGTEPWHHLASLAGVVALSALLWRPLSRSRRFLALGVLASSVLATVSGFWLLYWKEGIRVDGYQDWGVFWHIVWSWILLVFFVMHTWINRVAWLHLMRQTVSRHGGMVLHVGGYVLLLIAFGVTWSALGRGWFSSENYIQLSLYSWLLVSVPPYALWGYARARVRRPHPPAWLMQRLAHWRVRGWVDAALLPAAVLATVTGIVLAFFDGWTDARGLKYASKFWHVWPSVLFTVLAFVHSAQAWTTVRAHWRSYARGSGTTKMRQRRPGAERRVTPGPEAR